MPIEFKCPNCQQQLRVPDEAAGKQSRCPKCESITSVPSASQQSTASPFSDANAPGGPSPQINKPTPAKWEDNPYSSPSTDSYQKPEFPSYSGEVRNQVVDPGSVIGYAVEIWKVNLGLLVGVSVVVIGISYAMGFVLQIIQAAAENQNNNDMAIVLLFVLIAGNLISNAIQIFLGIGQAQIALKLARRQPAEFGDLFQGGSRFWPVVGGSILAGLALVLGMLMCVVPAILMILFFWPFYYLIVDEKTGVFDSFSTAQEVTRGNIGTAFLLWLASVAIIIVGLLAICVGVIFAAPLVTMIWATAYLMMSGQLPPSPVYEKS